MTTLAHITSADLPELLAAMIAGISIGLAAAVALRRR
jgi:hypothetical protein